MFCSRSCRWSAWRCSTQAMRTSCGCFMGHRSRRSCRYRCSSFRPGGGDEVLKTFFTNIYEHANAMNRKNLIALASEAGRRNGVKKLLDLGCDDGVWTRALADAVGADEIHGVEVVAEQAKK